MITITNNTEFGIDGSSGDYSGSFNSTNGASLLVGLLTDQTSGRSVTGVTYNSVALTEVFRQTLHYRTDRDCEFTWWLLNSPASGSNTLAVTTTGSTTFGVLGWVGALSHPVSVDGTDYHTIQNDTVGSDTTTDLSITQLGNGQTIAFVYGTVTPNAAAANYHNPGSGYTELADSQTVLTEANVGRFLEYRVYTDGAGAKTVDNGTNNFDLPGPGSPRTWFEAGILLSVASSGAGSPMIL